MIKKKISKKCLFEIKKIKTFNSEILTEAFNYFHCFFHFLFWLKIIQPKFVIFLQQLHFYFLDGTRLLTAGY